MSQTSQTPMIDPSRSHDSPDSKRTERNQGDIHSSHPHKDDGKHSDPDNGSALTPKSALASASSKKNKKTIALKSLKMTLKTLKNTLKTMKIGSSESHLSEIPLVDSETKPNVSKKTPKTTKKSNPTSSHPPLSSSQTGTSTTKTPLKMDKKKSSSNADQPATLFASLTMASAPDASFVPMPMFLFKDLPKRVMESNMRYNEDKVRKLQQQQGFSPLPGTNQTSHKYSDSPSTPYNYGKTNSSSASSSHHLRDETNSSRSQSTPKTRSSATVAPTGAPSTATPSTVAKTATKRTEMMIQPTQSNNPHSNHLQHIQYQQPIPNAYHFSPATPSSSGSASMAGASASRSVSLNLLTSILSPSATVTTASNTPNPAAHAHGHTNTPGATNTPKGLSMYASNTPQPLHFDHIVPPQRGEVTPSSAAASSSSSTLNALASIIPALAMQQNVATASTPTAQTQTSGVNSLSQSYGIDATSEQLQNTPSDVATAVSNSNVASTTGVNAASSGATTATTNRMQMLLNKHKRK